MCLTRSEYFLRGPVKPLRLAQGAETRLLGSSSGGDIPPTPELPGWEHRCQAPNQHPVCFLCPAQWVRAARRRRTEGEPSRGLRTCTARVPLPACPEELPAETRAHSS